MKNDDGLAYRTTNDATQIPVFLFHHHHYSKDAKSLTAANQKFGFSKCVGVRGFTCRRGAAAKDELRCGDNRPGENP